MRKMHHRYAALVLSFGALCGILQGAQAAQISTEASAHLSEIISVLQKEWLHRDKMDWGNLRQRVFRQAGAAQTIPDTSYRLITPNPRVAVLTDIGVASSGEAIAIAFRARPNTRSFGTPTCGLSTAVTQMPLSHGGQMLPFSQSARIAVVTSVMADRTKQRYGGAVLPDELVTEPAAVVPRAVSWLRGH